MNTVYVMIYYLLCRENRKLSNSMLTLTFRNVFLTQFEDSENLEQTGILEMDLSRLAINDLSKRVPGIDAISEGFLSICHSQSR